MTHLESMVERFLTEQSLWKISGKDDCTVTKGDSLDIVFKGNDGECIKYITTVCMREAMKSFSSVSGSPKDRDLQKRVRKLEKLCSELYQIISVFAMSFGVIPISVLTRLGLASRGEHFKNKPSLLPYEVPSWAQEALAQAKVERSKRKKKE